MVAVSINVGNAKEKGVSIVITQELRCAPLVKDKGMLKVKLRKITLHIYVDVYINTALFIHVGRI